MYRTAVLLAGFAGLCSAPLRADFSYQTTTKITGGAMAGAMKMAGVFSKAAREPIVSTVYVKGNRMAHVSRDHVNLIDLSSETISDIDMEKKTYSTITFADMRKAMDEMAKKLSEKKSADSPEANLNFKIDIKDTGKTQVWNGMDTKEAILTAIFEGQDQKTGQTGNLSMMSTMYLAPKIAGYDEVRDFQKRMAEKLAWSPGGGFAQMMQPGMSKGMSELAKEASKLDGLPVHQIIRMGSKEALVAAQNAPPKPEGQQQPQGPTAGQVAGEAATDSAASAITGKLGKLGGLGGLGGFGKKKKEPEQQPQKKEMTPEEQQAAQQQALASTVLMEMVTDSTNFSSAPVDPSKFEIPAGFKKVEHPMEKQIK